ncbi:hypothetical protein J6590_080096 [Homalodisca vitripennis]|nr:hypothetical protein J6590_080096 [Homalodisca vitripennis]
MDNHQGRTGALIGRGPREKGRGITGGDLRGGSRKIGSGCVRPFLAANSRTKIPSFVSHWANYRSAVITDTMLVQQARQSLVIMKLARH